MAHDRRKACSFLEQPHVNLRRVLNLFASMTVEINGSSEKPRQPIFCVAILYCSRPKYFYSASRVIAAYSLEGPIHVPQEDLFRFWGLPSDMRWWGGIEN
jgi:hypothetical protein